MVDPFITAFGTALELSIVPIMIMVALSAIAYMLSKLVKHPGFEVFARMELYQVLFSVILLVVIIFGTQALFEITSALAGGDPFEIAIDYLHNLVRRAFDAYTFAIGGRVGIEAASKTSLKLSLSSLIPIEALPVDFAVLFYPCDLSTLGGALDKIFAILSLFFGSLVVQQFGLEIIRAVMIPLVLPVGLFLRILPPTRSSGAFLIAVALSLIHI